MEYASILKYGVIGLGFLLAFLAYRLLTKEQNVENPRKNILTSIYVFMVFSISLCLIGFFADVQKQAPFKDAEIIDAYHKIEKNASKFNPQVVGFNNIRRYVDKTYSDEFLIKVVSSYPNKMELTCTTDESDLLAIKIK